MESQRLIEQLREMRRQLESVDGPTRDRKPTTTAQRNYSSLYSPSKRTAVPEPQPYTRSSKYQYSNQYAGYGVTNDAPKFARQNYQPRPAPTQISSQPKYSSQYQKSPVRCTPIYNLPQQPRNDQFANRFASINQPARYNIRPTYDNYAQPQQVRNPLVRKPYDLNKINQMAIDSSDDSSNDYDDGFTNFPSKYSTKNVKTKTSLKRFNLSDSDSDSDSFDYEYKHKRHSRKKSIFPSYRDEESESSDDTDADEIIRKFYHKNKRSLATTTKFDQPIKYTKSHETKKGQDASIERRQQIRAFIASLESDSDSDSEDYKPKKHSHKQEPKRSSYKFDNLIDSSSESIEESPRKNYKPFSHHHKKHQKKYEPSDDSDDSIFDKYMSKAGTKHPVAISTISETSELTGKKKLAEILASSSDEDSGESFIQKKYPSEISDLSSSSIKPQPAATKPKVEAKPKTELKNISDSESGESSTSELIRRVLNGTNVDLDTDSDDSEVRAIIKKHENYKSQDQTKPEKKSEMKPASKPSTEFDKLMNKYLNDEDLSSEEIIPKKPLPKTSNKDDIDLDEESEEEIKPFKAKEEPKKSIPRKPIIAMEEEDDSDDIEIKPMPPMNVMADEDEEDSDDLEIKSVPSKKPINDDIDEEDSTSNIKPMKEAKKKLDIEDEEESDDEKYKAILKRYTNIADKDSGSQKSSQIPDDEPSMQDSAAEKEEEDDEEIPLPKFAKKEVVEEEDDDSEITDADIEKRIAEIRASIVKEKSQQSKDIELEEDASDEDIIEVKKEKVTQNEKVTKLEKVTLEDEEDESDTFNSEEMRLLKAAGEMSSVSAQGFADDEEEEETKQKEPTSPKRHLEDYDAEIDFEESEEEIKPNKPETTKQISEKSSFSVKSEPAKTEITVEEEEIEEEKVDSYKLPVLVSEQEEEEEIQENNKPEKGIPYKLPVLVSEQEEEEEEIQEKNKPEKGNSYILPVLDSEEEVQESDEIPKPIINKEENEEEDSDVDFDDAEIKKIMERIKNKSLSINNDDEEDEDEKVDSYKLPVLDSEEEEENKEEIPEKIQREKVISNKSHDSEEEENKEEIIEKIQQEKVISNKLPESEEEENDEIPIPIINKEENEEEDSDVDFDDADIKKIMERIKKESLSVNNDDEEEEEEEIKHEKVDSEDILKSDNEVDEINLIKTNSEEEEIEKVVADEVDVEISNQGEEKEAKDEEEDILASYEDISRRPEPLNDSEEEDDEAVKGKMSADSIDEKLNKNVNVGGGDDNQKKAVVDGDEEEDQDDVKLLESLKNNKNLDLDDNEEDDDDFDLDAVMKRYNLTQEDLDDDEEESVEDI